MTHCRAGTGEKIQCRLARRQDGPSVSPRDGRGDGVGIGAGRGRLLKAGRKLRARGGGRCLPSLTGQASALTFHGWRDRESPLGVKTHPLPLPYILASICAAIS